MRASNISRIKPLPAVLIDRIAAGEVIEGPHSVIKECIENALDAHARSISVYTKKAGLEQILIEDDGDGILYEDLGRAIERHATSKIADLDDLETVLSFGFRGEALASIASVSRLELLTKHLSQDVGGRLASRGGELETIEAAAAKTGTTLKIEDLFYSVPARKKHVRSERLENARNYREIVKAALARPDVRFSYYRDDREFLLLPPHTSLAERIGAIYDTKLRDRLLSVDAELNTFRLTGFITDPQYYRSSRDGQFLFVNGRAVDFRHASFLVKKAYGELLPHGAQPCYFLFLSVDPANVDVNVHPAKREVRMLDESGLHTLLLRAVHRALHPKGPLSVSATTEINPSGAAGVSFTLSFPSRSRAFSPPEEPSAIPEPQTDEASDPVLSALTNEELVRAEQAAAFPDLASLRQLGVIFGTYILAEGPEGLFVIDQHTAHERVNFERIRGRLEHARRQRQPLLTPFAVDCEPDELQEILTRTDELVEAGFVIEEYGRSSYVVREVPTYLEPGEEKEAVVRVIRRILEGESVVRIYDEYAAMKACKASIKKNDVVSSGVLAGILAELARCKDPARCPHGRPTMVRIMPADLDKLFGRI